ncbi:MAG: hypothetical protein H2069_02665 [Legionella sp.]|nr:hypothetical protein [Legionella sp.]
MLTKTQQYRLDIIKAGFKNQLAAIQPSILAESSTRRKIVENLHDALETEFDHYLSITTKFIELQNNFNQRNISAKEEIWRKTKFSLTQRLDVLKNEKFKEKPQEVFVADAKGRIELQKVRSFRERELQAKIDQIIREIEGTKKELQLLRRESDIFQNEIASFKHQSTNFKNKCNVIIDRARPAFEHYGNLQAAFNCVISLVSAVTSVFRSLRIKTSAEEILDKITYNINVAVRKAKHIDLSEFEFQGVINIPTFRQL